MNLRHTSSETAEIKNQGTPWYKQTQTIIEIAAPPVSPSTPITTAQPVLFEPSDAERILARAAALQEVHGQMLSQEQIAAVAAEIGIKPEFVHLAIEQEQAAAVAPPRSVVETTEGHQLFAKARTAVIASLGISFAYGVLANALLDSLYPSKGFFWLTFFFPALLALIYGVLARSRRAGAAAGAILAATVIVALLLSFGLLGSSVSMQPSDVLVFVAMIVSGALLGATGAQVRRIISRRQTSNRNRKQQTIHFA